MFKPAGCLLHRANLAKAGTSPSSIDDCSSGHRLAKAVLGSRLG